jgi:S-DNA-T family DNA segregation ATPase FtsK/SpoIIIE
LQRKLSIGYNRAARIMDELEDRGMVGPDNGSQGREILLDL